MAKIQVRSASLTHLWLAVLGALALVTTEIAFAQAGSKDAQRFQSLTNAARNDLDSAGAQLETTLAAYNSIINGTADNLEKAHKELTKGISKTTTAWNKAGKSFEKMEKAGNKLFAEWQKETDAFTNEEMKKISMDRLEVASANSKRMLGQMAVVRGVYASFMTSLQEQAQFMGLDMSPDAITALQPMAAELNTYGAELSAGIDTLLNRSSEIDLSVEVIDSAGTVEVIESVEVIEPVEGVSGDETTF